MNKIKNITLIICWLTLPVCYLFGQNRTLLFVEDFDEISLNQFTLNGGGLTNSGNNRWIINNSYDGLGIYANTPSQDSTVGGIGKIGTPGGNYMHIRDYSSSPLNATYKPSNNSDRWTVMKAGVCTYGYSRVILTFWWCTKGSDYAFGEVYYSIDGGVSWILTTNTDGFTKYNNMNKWKYTEVDMQQSINRDDLRFAFRWFNSNSDTTGELSFSVDDVIIVGEYDPVSNPPVDIIAVDIAPSPVCHEDVNNQTLTFRISFSDTLCPGGYQLEISDSNCNFDNATPLVNLTGDFVYPGFVYSVAVNLLLPTSIPIASCYCFRVNRTSPPFITGIGNTGCFEIIDCLESIDVAKPPVMLTDTYCESNTICVNSAIDVPFYSYGAYNPGNSYYLELSDSSGSFVNAKTIGGPDPSTQTHDPAIYPLLSPGSSGGKIPDVPDGCNYYIRVNSTNPPVIGSSWGPFCIKHCDIETNNNLDISVCITDSDSVCVMVPIDINVWDTSAFYNDSNQFLVQILSSKDFSIVNQGVLGAVYDTVSNTLKMCIPKFSDYLAIPMELKMYYMRIISTKSSDSTDQCGTIIHLSVSGISGKSLAVYTSGDTSICASQDTICFVIRPTGLPGTSKYEFIFSSGGSFLWDPQNPEHPPFQPTQKICFNAYSFPTGTTSVTVQEQFSENCKGPASPPVSFSIKASPPIDFDGDFNVCVGDTVTYSANFEPATYYDWLRKGGTVIDSANNEITIVWDTYGFGYFIGLFALGYCGEDFGTRSVTVLPKTQAHTMEDTTICVGQSVKVTGLNLTTSYDNTYLWTSDNNTDSIPHTIIWNDPDSVSVITVKPDSTTIYIIKIDNSPPDGCADYDSVKVNVKTVSYPDDTLAMCLGDTLKLNVNVDGQASYLWTPASGLSDNDIEDPFAYPLDSTIYTIIANFNDGCIDTLLIKLDVIPTFFNIGPDDTISPGQQTTLYSTGGITYLWAPPTGLDFTSIPSPIASPDTTTTYKVIITDSTGCVREGNVTVYVFTPEIIIPKAFSPNGDGLNDTFSPIYLAIADMYIFRIYNRWGEVIFETDDVNTGWDGTYKGVPQEIGTYIYYIKAKTVEGVDIEIKNNMALIR